MSKPITQITRRTALKGVAGLIIGFHLPAGTAKAQSGAAQVFAPDTGAATFAPNAFIRIGGDDTVTVLVKHIEFGQGPFTGLATLAAEELDADWRQVRAEHAPSNPELYKNSAFGVQGTGGSTAIANSYEQMRKAGATARAMLIAAAAQAWRVPESEITIERGTLRHVRRTRRSGEFAPGSGAIANAGECPAQGSRAIPCLSGARGRSRKLDSAAKANGTAQFTIDIHEPNMLTVVVARPAKILVPMPPRSRVATRWPFVAWWTSRRFRPELPSMRKACGRPSRGAKKLRVTWDEAKAEKRGSDQLVAEYRELSRKAGMVAGQHGDVDAALGTRTKDHRSGIRLSLPRACANGAARWLPGAGLESAR